MDKLPENVVRMEILQLNRNIEKHCKCATKKLIVDPTNRMVYCDKCKAYIDPFEAILYIATVRDDMQRETDRMLEYKKEIASYNPSGKLFKDLQQRYGRGKHRMLPTCPVCSNHFRFEDIKGWTNADWIEALEKRKSEIGRQDPVTTE